ncbi:hypothetical protein PENTCL1PPCAC_14945, partial [Pristionchus entomophagus]
SYRKRPHIQFPKSWKWIEQGRNFGVTSMDDGLIYTITLSVIWYTIFGVVLTSHIFIIIRTRNQLRSSATWTVTIRQTRQSMVQLAVFLFFLITPISMFMSLVVFEFEDGKPRIVAMTKVTFALYFF